MNGLVRKRKLMYECTVLQSQVNGLKVQVLSLKNDSDKFEEAFRLLGVWFRDLPATADQTEINAPNQKPRVIQKRGGYLS